MAALIGELDQRRDSKISALRERPPSSVEPATDVDLRFAISDRLHDEVDHMNLDNFVVRPKRRLVETFKKPESWEVLSADDRLELGHEVAGLPYELDPEAE